MTVTRDTAPQMPVVRPFFSEQALRVAAIVLASLLHSSFPTQAPGPHRREGGGVSQAYNSGGLQPAFHGSGVRDRSAVHGKTSMGLSQDSQDLTRNSGHTRNLMFLLEQCLCALELVALSLAPLSWSVHSLVTMDFSKDVSLCRDVEPIR